MGQSKSSSKTLISSGRMPLNTTQTGTPQVHTMRIMQQFEHKICILAHSSVCVCVFPLDRQIRHRACALKDTVHAIIRDELDEDFEKICEEIKASRGTRGEFCVYLRIQT